MQGAFDYLPDIKTIDLPNTLETISSGSFKFGGEITKLVIPEGVKKVESMGINSTSITTVEIPASLTDLVDTSFNFSSSAKFTVDSDNPKYKDGIGKPAKK